jgi:hypothetical protein
MIILVSALWAGCSDDPSADRAADGGGFDGGGLDGGGLDGGAAGGGDRRSDAATDTPERDGSSAGRDSGLSAVDARTPPGDAGAEDAAVTPDTGVGAEPPPSTIDELITVCPSEQTLDEIDADFELVWQSDITAGTFVCSAAEGSRDLTKGEERLYQALIAARALEFDRPLPWTSLSLYEWLVESIDGIIVSDQFVNSFCCTAGPSRPGKYLNLHFGENSATLATDLWSNLSGVGLVNLLDLIVHEARHANGPIHTCPDNSSDRTLTELGAWGAVYEFHRSLAFHSDPCFLRPSLPPDPKYRAQLLAEDGYMVVSRTAADRTAMVRFCDSPPPIADPPEPVVTCARQ